MQAPFVTTSRLTTLLAATIVSVVFAAFAPPAFASNSGIPTPRVTVINQPCPDVDERATTAICAYPDGRLYMPADADPFIREHELGHAFITQYLDAGERNKATRLVGLPRGTPWFNGTGLAGFDSPDELTADAYAACRLKMNPDRGWETSYDYYPTRRELRVMCAFLERAAR